MTHRPQQQTSPGTEAKLTPEADHGEQSYKGSGKLESRAAVITGGDSGIGRAVAIVHAREGARLRIPYLDEEEDAQETKRVFGFSAVAKILVRAVAERESDPCRSRTLLASYAKHDLALTVLLS